MRGFKSYLGSLVKGAAGAALGFVINNSHDIPVDPNTKTGLAVSIALLFLGDALQKIGLAHKMDKQTAAIEDNTVANAEK